MAYYLGIDAGATKTDCALALDSTVLARVRGGTIKAMRVSEEVAGKNLDEILQSISAEARVPLNRIASTGIGLAGVSVPRIANGVRKALHARVGGTIVMSGDDVIALDAAFQGGRGVLVMAGTGSNMVGRAADGVLVHVGGWGPAVADEGSGTWIGKHAVRAIFDALDHGDSTPMLDRVMQAWNVDSIGTLIGRCNESPGPNFSQLAPITAEIAAKGDPYAQGVLRTAGEDLGKYAVLTAQRVLQQEGGSGEFPEIAFTGSILARIAPVQEAMRSAILRQAPQARVHPEAVDSVLGAFWRARELGARECASATS